MYLHLVLCCMYVFELFMYVAKGGEKMGILEIKILYFQNFKIKQKLKKKGGERDE